MDIAGRRVLLVDGHVDTVDSLAMLLVLYGHAVERCYDGSLAMEAALRFQPDVVILEQRLPGPVGGLALGQLLSEQPRLAGVTLVLQSATLRPDDQRLAYGLGFRDCMLKPIDPDIILGAVERAPARRQALPA